MRWDELFADLEAQAAALERAERAAEIEERTRSEIGLLGLVDRARAATGLAIRVRLPGPLTVSGRLARVGPDWWHVDEGGGREAIVATGRILGVRGLPRHSAVPDSAGVVESRLGLRQALRGVSRDRSTTRLHLFDGSTLDATIDRVGRDFIEVAAHPAGEVRRRQEVIDVELVPLSALVAVRRQA